MGSQRSRITASPQATKASNVSLFSVVETAAHPRQWDDRCGLVGELWGGDVAALNDRGRGKQRFAEQPALKEAECPVSGEPKGWCVWVKARKSI